MLKREERKDQPLTAPRPEAFGFYLPQFYPAPLNDDWWGEGFTEWNSLVGSVRGSRSPRGTTLTPGEMGFYDLRMKESRAAQAALARESGLSAFCMYHYYSRGYRPMDVVVDAMLSDGEPDHPFFLCWANHDWTRAWMNRPQDIIFKQGYNEHENDDHFRWLLTVFKRANYFCIGSAPVLAIYDPWSVPDAVATFRRWRQLAVAEGFSSLILFGVARRHCALSSGDAGMDYWIEDALFPLRSVPAARRVKLAFRSPGGMQRMVRHGDYPISRRMVRELSRQTRTRSEGSLVPTVITSFNNVGRRQRRASYLRPSPMTFREDLRVAMEHAPVVASPDGQRRLIAINAWNEWGESMVMEPSVEFGRSFIQAASEVLSASE